MLLDDHCSESNRAGVCDDLGALGVAVEVSRGSYFREFPFECVEGVLLLRSPDEASAFVRQAAERLGGCRETRDQCCQVPVFVRIFTEIRPVIRSTEMQWSIPQI